MGFGFGGMVSDWPCTVVKVICGSWSWTAVIVAGCGLFESTASLYDFWSVWRSSMMPGNGFVLSVPCFSW